MWYVIGFSIKEDTYVIFLFIC